MREPSLLAEAVAHPVFFWPVVPRDVHEACLADAWVRARPGMMCGVLMKPVRPGLYAMVALLRMDSHSGLTLPRFLTWLRPRRATVPAAPPHAPLATRDASRDAPRTRRDSVGVADSLVVLIR